jgi:hypothetical protein
MATTFAELKKNRRNQIEELSQKVKELTKPQTNSDDNYWTPTVDKSGNGYAVIRLLPSKAGEDLPWVRYYEHGFQGPSGLWYIEKSLTSIGQDDPVGEYNSKLWNSGVEANKDLARKQKRRLNYVSNIYVVSDTGNPETEGKVFRFRYGKKIFDKINEAMNPEFEDETPINPFDFWDGANFKLKIRNVEGYRNYDKSEFDEPAPLSTEDGNLEEIYNQLHSLNDFVDPSKYKSYEELEAKMRRVLCLDEEEKQEKRIEEQHFKAETKIRETVNDSVKTDDTSSDSSDDDFDDDYFKRLVNG